MLPIDVPLRRAGGAKIGRTASGAASSSCRRCSRSPTCSAATRCVVYATQRDFDTAALLIGIAMVLDTLDGFVARLTNSSSAFGVQLDSLADVVSFGLAPAILAFTWGLWPLKRLGWAAGFIYVTATAMRLARFNIQTAAVDRQAVLRRHAEPGGRRGDRVDGLSVSRRPAGSRDGVAALAMVLVPALLMVSTIRFRSVKAIDVGWRRSYFALFLVAVVLALIASHPRLALVALAYSYTVGALVVWVYNRARRRPAESAGADG